MEKLNLQKEPMIEILRLIEKKMAQVFQYSIYHPNETVVVNFNVYFYSREDETKGDVYFEQIGKLKA